MKYKISFSLVLFLSVIFFLFTNPFAEINSISDLPPSPDNQFLITAMHSGEIDPNYTYLPDLGINSWHKYTGPIWGWPGISNDRYDQDTSAYRGAVIQRINDNKNYGFRSVMDRPKIEYLAFGQKSEYQCEDSSKVDQNFKYYTYKEHQTGTDIQDDSQFGNNQWVKYCQSIQSSPGSNAGYVVKGLISNREQANRSWPPWIADSASKWYVMPKIRIPAGLPNSTPVCRVEVLDWNGTIIKSVNLNTENFKKSQVVPYDGRYREDYFFEPNDDSSAIDIPIGAICPGPRRDFSNWWQSTVSTDFRVYWYGQCDMWIDHVKVVNEPAHQLFKGLWDQQIREETDIALSNYDPLNPIPNNFYIEEFEFNIIDALKHVNTIIRERSNNKLSLMVNLNYQMLRFHIPYWQNEFSAAQLNDYLVNKAGLKYLVNVSYPLEGFVGSLYPVNIERTSAHPVTLLSSDYTATTGVLSYVKSVSEYENWLQSKIDFGIGSADGFMKIMKKTDSLSRYYSPDLKIIHLTQAHSWWQRAHKLKEPSNEEMNLMTNLSIGYGAKGIMYFSYGSKNINFDTLNDLDYTRGLVNPDGLPRHSNVYGQDKWNAVKKINNIMTKWGPSILKFNQLERRSYAYHLSNERSDMLSNGQFINEIYTYKPGIDGNALTTSDPLNERYIQATFFDKYYYLNPPPHPKSKYFMITNRRCSPFIDNSSTDNIGGKRNIKVKLSHSLLGFAKFRNVSLVDIGNDSILTTFYNDVNVNNNPTIDLGWFNPGEGKIFRLSPALCVGGTLVADELDVFKESFICEGNVFTNGKDVLLEDSINIEFTSTGKFTVNGGTFGCISSSPTINLKGLNGQLWSGFSFTNCTFAFQNVKFENTTGYPLTILNSNANITDCEFNSNSSAILMDQTTNVSGTNLYLKNSKFNMGNIGSPTCNLRGNGGAVINVFLDNNEFTSANGNAAVILNAATGSVKNSKVTDYFYSFFINNSSIDLYNNELNSSLVNSTGIKANAMSHINLGINGSGYFTGGQNKIYNSGTNSKNIHVDNSFFNIHRGYNDLSIPNESATLSKHLIGYFPALTEGEGYPSIYSRYNCFNLNHINESAIHNVNWNNTSNQVDFLLTPYSSGIIVEEEAGIVAENETGESDTIMMMSDFEQEDLSADQELYDNLIIEMRKGEYENVVNTSKELISTYANSLGSNELTIDAVSKLYSASLQIDLSSSQIEDLKTYYETIILNHLKTRSFCLKYFILYKRVK